MKTSLFIFFLFLLFNCPHLSQTRNDKAAAVINDEKITAEEFRLRFELSPYLSEKYDRFQVDSLKLDFLYSLIAEKIWAIEAEKAGLANDKKFRFYFGPVKEMLLRDALFKEVIEKKVVVSDVDIIKGMKKYHTTITVNILSSPDSLMMMEIFERISASGNPDSLIINDDLIKRITTLREVSLGTLRDEALEDSIYNLDPGEYTKPFMHDSFWVIFFVKNKTSGAGSALTDEQILSDVKRKIKNRRLEKVYTSYADSLLSGKTYTTDKDNFYAAAERIISLLQTRKDTIQKEYFLQEEDYSNIINSGGEDFPGKVLFTIDKNPFTILDFLGNLAFDQFKTTSLEKDNIFGALSKKINSYMQQRILVNEANKKGLENLPEVKRDIETWKDHYLSQMYKTSYKDSVIISGDDVYNYYLQKINAGGLKLINLALLTTPDLNVIGDILDKIKAGSNFMHIAEEFGKTDELVNDKGVTGLVSVMQLGELGSIAENVKEGEVYGPLRRAGGYSIFSVIEKKNSSDSLSAAFENVKDGLRGELFNSKMNEMLTQKTVKFISGNKVQINADVVEGIKVNTIPVFVHRMMGFGGRIAGVPFTTPFSGWADQIESQKLFP